MNRSVIGIVAALLAMQPGWTAAQDPAGSDGWVVLPVDDYRALRAKAFPSPPDPVPPPVDATLTRVDYALRVRAGDTVRGEVRLTIDVLKQGMGEHPGAFAGLLVRERAPGRAGATALVDGNAAARARSRATGRAVAGARRRRAARRPPAAASRSTLPAMRPRRCRR